MTYLVLKALHAASVLFWLAALLYLPRLFVYHAEALARPPGPEREALASTFAVMERRLLRAIANPAMLLAFAFGLALMASGSADITSGWFAVKILLLLPLFAFHGFCGLWRKQLAAEAPALEGGAREERAPPSARFFRLVNEIPAVLALAILLLAFVKPF